LEIITGGWGIIIVSRMLGYQQQALLTQPCSEVRGSSICTMHTHMLGYSLLSQEQISAEDPDLLNQDLDPAFQVNPDPDRDPGLI
jgi:hypothetical protein